MNKEEYYKDIWEQGKPVRDFLCMNLWRDLVGLPEKDFEVWKKPEFLDSEKWRKSEWAEDFMSVCKCNLDFIFSDNFLGIEGKWKEFTFRMKNRMLFGRIRYGRFSDIERGKDYDYVGYITKKIKLYKEDGNQERLCDAANSAMLEYHKGRSDRILTDVKFSFVNSNFDFDMFFLIDGYHKNSNSTKYLVLIVCLCFIEYLYPTNLKAHWSSVDDVEHYSGESNF